MYRVFEICHLTRIIHVDMIYLNKLVSKDLVVCLPKIKFEKDDLCDVCLMHGQTNQN